MKKLIIPLVFTGIALGCNGDVPTGTDLTPDFGVAGNSGCYTVSGALDQVIVPGGLEGSISGDVEGLVFTVGVPSRIQGKVLFVPGQQTWKVQGGIIEPLIGQELYLDVGVRGITAQLPLVHINTTARVVEGAQKGNLTYHGTTNVATGTSRLEYHGVICPY